VKLLLDTCAFLRLAGSNPLPPRAAEAIRASSNEVFLSAVSVWEIVTKHQAGKLPLPCSPARLVPEECARRGVAHLPFDDGAALQLLKLPALHRDPFDRMLICQAIAEGMAILTPDPLIEQYPIRVIW
jgi:PIN domain nuclease of toxin-antitoxin system